MRKRIDLSRRIGQNRNELNYLLKTRLKKDLGCFDSKVCRWISSLFGKNACMMRIAGEPFRIPSAAIALAHSEECAMRRREVTEWLHMN